MSADEDDEMMNDFSQKNQSFDWAKFKRLFLFNKRIWKYIVLYSMIYFSVRKYCAPWYKNTSIPISVNDSLGTDEMIFENMVGYDSHKPASNSAILADAVAHILLVSGSKYRNATVKELIESIDSKYKNSETDNHLLDVHISVWIFLLFIDGLYCYKKNKFNKDDALMAIHHLGGLITSSILKYKQKGGLFWCWVGLYSEGMACLMLIGSLTRIYYQKRRPDLEWIKHFGDITFALHMIGFLYIRIYAFTKVMSSFIPKWCNDKSNHILTKIWMATISGLMLPVGWYWSYHSLRVVYEKIIQLNSKK